MKGDLLSVEYESSDEGEMEEEEEEEEEVVVRETSKPRYQMLALQYIFSVFSKVQVMCLFISSSKKGGGLFGMLKGLVGSKSLTREDMEPVLEKMRDHLISMTSSTIFMLKDIWGGHCLVLIVLFLII